MAGAEQDANIRSFVSDRIGEEPPPDYRFIWGGDFESFLAGFGVTTPGDYELRIRAIDQQNPDGGSRVLATYPEGVDTFTIEVTGDADPPDGGPIVPADGGPADAASDGDGGGGSGSGSGGCGCATTATAGDGSAGGAALALIVLTAIAARRRRNFRRFGV